MSKFTFTHTLDDLKITHEFEAIQINKVVENFEDFLRGCGYVFDGNLEIVEQEKFPLEEYETFSTMNLNLDGIEGAVGSDYIYVTPPGGAGGADCDYVGDWDTQCKNIDKLAKGRSK